MEALKGLLTGRFQHLLPKTGLSVGTVKVGMPLPPLQIGLGIVVRQEIKVETTSLIGATQIDVGMAPPAARPIPVHRQDPQTAETLAWEMATDPVRETAPQEEIGPEAATST